MTDENTREAHREREARAQRLSPPPASARVGYALLGAVVPRRLPVPQQGSVSTQGVDGRLGDVPPTQARALIGVGDIPGFDQLTQERLDKESVAKASAQGFLSGFAGGLARGQRRSGEKGGVEVDMGAFKGDLPGTQPFDPNDADVDPEVRRLHADAREQFAAMRVKLDALSARDAAGEELSSGEVLQMYDTALESNQAQLKFIDKLVETTPVGTTVYHNRSKLEQDRQQMIEARAQYAAGLDREAESETTEPDQAEQEKVEQGKVEPEHGSDRPAGAAPLRSLSASDALIEDLAEAGPTTALASSLLPPEAPGAPVAPTDAVKARLDRFPELQGVEVPTGSAARFPELAEKPAVPALPTQEQDGGYGR